MNTVSALTLIFIQLAIVLAAMFFGRMDFINIMAVYGSPVYLITHFGDIAPTFYSRHFGHIILFTFQTFKYFFLIRSFTIDNPTPQRNLCVVMEAMYLGISYYYVSLV